MAKKPKKKVKKKAKPKKTGRPTKYRAKFCQALIDFFDIEPWEEREIPHYKAGDVSWTDIKLLPVRMPTLRKFAKDIGVAFQNVYKWVDKHEEFRDAFTQAKKIRKEWLIDGGLSGVFHPASFKFVAINVTDMTDKHEQVLGVTDALSELLKEIGGSGLGIPISSKKEPE